MPTRSGKARAGLLLTPAGPKVQQVAAMTALRPLAALLACAALQTGCAAPHAGTPAAPYLATRAFDPTILLTALAMGTLTVRDGCIRLGDALVVWPRGTRLVREGRRQVVVTPDGRRYAPGSRVALGGGGSDIPPDRLATPLPPACTGPFFHAN